MRASERPRARPRSLTFAPDESVRISETVDYISGIGQSDYKEYKLYKGVVDIYYMREVGEAELALTEVDETMSNNTVTLTIAEEVYKELTEQKGEFETWNSVLMRLAEGEGEGDR
jgi:hypothetical protein